MIIRLIGVFALLAGCGCHTAGSPPPPPSPSPSPHWLTFNDPPHRVHFSYPQSWKLDADPISVAHYSMVSAAINSAGKDGLIVHELPTGPGELELNPEIIAQQVPLGTAYIDLSWQEGPGPPDEPIGSELAGNSLNRTAKTVESTASGDLEMRVIRFWKFGKSWKVAVYLHLPVGAGLRADVDQILASFRFD
jgi:hypothetical protein